MAVDLDSFIERPFNLAGFEIREVVNCEGLNDFVYVIAPIWSGLVGKFKDIYLEMEVAYGFDRPLQKRDFVGYLENEPVAASTYLLGSGVAGLYRIATRPDFRGRGIGTQMTLEPLRRVRSLGYKVGVLHSSEMGYPVYEKMGFKEYCRIVSYYLEA